MARARNIKPSLFKNELLGEADPLLTILFTGLWCLADRDGKLEDRPRRIQAEIFPYRELPLFNGYLTELQRLGFIDRYTVGNIAVIKVCNFEKHQSPHKTEKPSELPDQPLKSDSCPITEITPLNNGSLTVKESLIPDSLIPDSLIPEGSADAPQSKRFTIPTIEDISNYCQQRGNSVNPEKFIAYYSSNGWKVGRNKMVDWRAAVHTWEQGENAHTKNPVNGNQNKGRRTTADEVREARERARNRHNAGQPDLGSVVAAQ